MTSRKRRPLAWALCLAGASACTQGGQSSDDGAPARDAGAPDAATPDDAGTPRFTTVVLVVLDGDVIYGCGAGIPAASTDSSESERVQAASATCEGSGGRWSCWCNGRMDESPGETSYAATCVGALRELCGVEAEALEGSGAPPDVCEIFASDRAGRCERAPSGELSCTCRGQAAPTTSDEDSCEHALFAACARGCSDDYGGCEPTAGGRVGAFHCESLLHGLSHDVLAGSCQDALMAGVDPVFETPTSCNGYGGFCDRAGDSSLRCACTDGSMHEVVYDTSDRYAPCRRALEAACGTGEPPDDAVCTANGNDYAARCTRAPASDAPHQCECVLQGANRDELLAAETSAGTTCEAALLRTCPQTQPIDDADRVATCDHYDRCDDRHPGFALGACLASVRDVCVACTVEQLATIATGPDGCPELRPACAAQCSDLVPRDMAVAACEASLEQREALTDEGRCMCDRCYPAFGQCMADDGCVELLQCATEQGCDASTCEMDPVCGPVVARYYSTRALSLALQVGACEAAAECATAARP